MSRKHPPYLQLVAEDGVEKLDTCHHQSKRLLTVESMELDDIELLTLHVLRYLCSSFSQESSLGWDTAHHFAEADLGLADGTAFVAHIVAILRATRDERQMPFNFLPPNCPTCSQKITTEEIQILAMLRAARKGELPLLGRLAAQFAQVQHAPRISIAAQALGVRLDVYDLMTERIDRPAGLPRPRE